MRRIHNWLNSHVLMTKLFRKLGLCQDLKIIRRLTWPLTQHQRSPSLECKKNQFSFTNQRIKMTISYGQQVATSSGLGVFWKLLFLWRGSIYKLVWTNLALYIFLYYSLSLTYRFLLDENGRVRLLLRDFLVTLTWNWIFVSRKSLSNYPFIVKSTQTWFQLHLFLVSM